MFAAMPDELQRRWFTQGAAFACIFASAFILSGALWSAFKIEDIGFIDHLYNGLVFATWANIASLVLGFSVGLTAMMSVGKDEKINLRLVGFGLMNFLIIGFLWWGGHIEMRKNEPPSLSEKLFDYIENKQTEN